MPHLFCSIYCISYVLFCLFTLIIRFFCGIQTTVRGDDLEKEQEEDKKRLLDALPVVTTSFAVAEPTPSSLKIIEPSPKRRRQIATETEISSADMFSSFRDEDELFLLSLLPSLKRLTIKKRMEVRMKFQQVLYAAEFED